MTAFEVISYIVLWILVVVLCLLMIGFLQQMGLLQRKLAALEDGKAQHLEQSAANPAILPLEEDGPPLGTALPDLAFETINGYGTVSLTIAQREREQILLFLAPTCESCQYTVEVINKLIEDGTFRGNAIAFLRADEHSCRAFQRLFPSQFPVVCDADRSIAMRLDAHRTPFGLLYDREGQLVRKAIVETREDFLALLGDRTVLPQGQTRVFPPLSATQVEVP